MTLLHKWGNWGLERGRSWTKFTQRRPQTYSVALNCYDEGPEACRGWPGSQRDSSPKDALKGPISFLSKVLIPAGVGEGWWIPASQRPQGSSQGPGQGAGEQSGPPDLAGRGGQRTLELQGRGKESGIPDPGRRQLDGVGLGQTCPGPQMGLGALG